MTTNAETVTAPPSDRLRQRNSEMARLALDGLNLTEIAEQFGVTRQRVQQILAAQGITTRTREARREASRRRTADIDAAKVETACTVCGTVFRQPPTGWRKTCSSPCARWRAAHP